MPTADVTLKVTMTNHEWAEVIAALDTKETLVKDDFYGEDHPGGNITWAAQLGVAKAKIGAALHKAGYRY